MPAARLVRALIEIVALVAPRGACPAPGSRPAASGVPATATIEVSAAWVRPAAAGAKTAAYLTITNHGPADKLIAVHTTIARSAMIHQTATDSSGMTGMSMVDDVPIPAGGTVTLEPGGMHLMLAGLTAALADGSTVELELVFEHAGAIRVSTAVRQG
jgi:copper(I)-binding protein